MYLFTRYPWRVFYLANSYTTRKDTYIYGLMSCNYGVQQYLHHMNCLLVAASSTPVDWETMISHTTVFHATKLSVEGKEAVKRDKQQEQSEIR